MDLYIMLYVSCCLQMSRLEPLYLWARKYAHWREMFKKGEMPEDVWVAIDRAYDVGPLEPIDGKEEAESVVLTPLVLQAIYDEKARLVYDFWGPETSSMTLLETQCNVGLFYLLWGTIM
jgi:hypothetical protein